MLSQTSTALIDVRLADEKHSSVEESHFFTLVKLSENFEKGQFSGCLALDFDETILCYVESERTKQINIKDEEQLREILEKAQKNNLMIVVVTARTEKLQDAFKDAPYLAIEPVLKTIGIDYFSAIYYTNGNYKSHALFDIKRRIFHSDKKNEGFKKIAFVDDLDVYLNECRAAGFSNSFCVDDLRLRDYLNRFFYQKETTVEELESKTITVEEVYGEVLESIYDLESDCILNDDNDYFESVEIDPSYRLNKILEECKLSTPENRLQLSRLTPENLESLLQEDNREDFVLLAENGLLNNFTMKLMNDFISIPEFVFAIQNKDINKIKEMCLQYFSQPFYFNMFMILTQLKILNITDEGILRKTFNVISQDSFENLSILAQIMKDHSKLLLDQGIEQYHAILKLLELLTGLHLNNKENMNKIKQIENFDFVKFYSLCKDLHDKSALNSKTLTETIESLMPSKVTMGLKQS